MSTQILQIYKEKIFMYQKISLLLKNFELNKDDSVFKNVLRFFFAPGKRLASEVRSHFRAGGFIIGAKRARKLRVQNKTSRLSKIKKGMMMFFGKKEIFETKQSIFLDNF